MVSESPIEAWGSASKPKLAACNQTMAPPPKPLDNEKKGTCRRPGVRIDRVVVIIAT